MTRAATRPKNFGMAKAVLVKNSTQNRKNGKKSSPPPRKTQTKTQTKTKAPTKSQTKPTPAASKPVPKTRSTQSIEKREKANASNPTPNRRAATKSSDSADTFRKPRSKNLMNASESNVTNARKSSKKASNSKFDDKSQSIFDKQSLEVYEALDYFQKRESPETITETLVNGLNDVVSESASIDTPSIGRLCPKSPDLFESSDEHENDTLSDDNTKIPETENQDVETHFTENTSKDRVQMIDGCAQASQIPSKMRDACVQTSPLPSKMVDTGIQMTPVKCKRCKCNVFEKVSDAASYINSCDRSDNSDNVLNNFNEFIDPKDDISYLSDEDASSYDHCLDDFDPLEHIDQTIDPCQSPNDYNMNGPLADDSAVVIDNSPPRYQIYKDDKFHSPESLNSQNNQRK